MNFVLSYYTVHRRFEKRALVGDLGRHGVEVRLLDEGGERGPVVGPDDVGAGGGGGVPKELVIF